MILKFFTNNLYFNELRPNNYDMMGSNDFNIWKDDNFLSKS